MEHRRDHTNRQADVDDRNVDHIGQIAAIRPPTKLISPNITAETMIPSSRLKTSGISAVRIVPPA